MISPFNDIEGTPIEEEIVGFKDGQTIDLATDNPLLINIKPLGGGSEYFPAMMSKTARLIFLCPSFGFFDDLQTSSYAVTITRAGENIFRGFTKVFNNQEPIDTTPYEFEVFCYDEISTWKGKSFYDISSTTEKPTNELLSSNGIFENAPSLAYDDILEEAKHSLRSRLLYKEDFFEIAEQLSTIYFSTIYLKDDQVSFYFHDYAGLTITRKLTESYKQPLIIYSSPVKEGKINSSIQADDDLLLITEQSLSPPQDEVQSRIYKDFSFGAFTITCDLININYDITPNQALIDDLAIENVRTISFPFYVFEILLQFEGPDPTDWAYWDRFTQNLQFPGSKQSIDTVQSVNYRLNTFGQADRIIEFNIDDIGVVNSGNFGLFQRVYVEYKLSNLSGTVKYGQSGSLNALRNGGTFTISTQEININVSFTPESFSNISPIAKKPFPESEQITVNCSSSGSQVEFTANLRDYYRVQSDLNLNPDVIEILVDGSEDEDINKIDPYFRNWMRKTDPETPTTLSSLEDTLIKRLVSIIETLFTGEQTVIDVELKPDQTMYKNPVEPFNYDAGVGDQLFHLIEGKLNVKQNIFSGSIHKINQ